MASQPQESPAEDIRNALAILQAGWPRLLSPSDYSAIYARLQSALDKLEKPALSLRVPRTPLPDSEWNELIRWDGEDPTFTLHNPGWWSVIRLVRGMGAGPNYLLEGRAYSNVDPYRGRRG